MTATASTQNEGRERRRYHRKNVVDRQLVTVDLGGGRAGILIDLSEDGMAIQPFLPLKVGLRLQFEFDLPRGFGRVSGEGSVMWTGRTGRTGIRFLQLSDRSWSHVERWVKESQDPLGEMLRNLKLQEQEQSAAPVVEKLAPEVSSDQPINEFDRICRAGSAAVQQPSDELDIDTAFNLITEHACTITRADGAALILTNHAGFVCRASIGNAPEVGTRVSLDSTLTGDCLRLGVTVNCGDASTDKRVNSVAMEQLNLRSILVVPVLLDGKVIGAIETLSSNIEAFTERDVRRLEQLADIAAKSADDL